MTTLIKQISPDIKAKYIEEVPTAPKVFALIPIVVYMSLLYAVATLSWQWMTVRSLEKQFPLDVQEQEKLQADIEIHKANIARAEGFYKVFIKWRSWFNESPPLSPVVQQILSAIDTDTRINALDLAHSEDGPNQLRLSLRIAVTRKQATAQFDAVISAMKLIKYEVAGGIDQTLDNDAIAKYPTPNGLPRENFHRLDVTFVDHNALPPLHRRKLNLPLPPTEATP